jgi:hypothetical protein
MLLTLSLELISSSHFYFKSTIMYSSANKSKSQVSEMSSGNFSVLWLICLKNIRFVLPTIDPLKH